MIQYPMSAFTIVSFEPGTRADPRRAHSVYFPGLKSGAEMFMRRNLFYCLAQRFRGGTGEAEDALRISRQLIGSGW